MQRRKVMLVDDDEDFLEETSELLEAAGYDVQTAASSREALERIIEEPPEIILLDYILPDNGGSLVLKLVENGDIPEMPIVMISGTPLDKISEEMEDLSEKAVVNAFMEKPIEPLDMIAMIESNLNNRQAE